MGGQFLSYHAAFLLDAGSDLFLEGFDASQYQVDTSGRAVSLYTGMPNHELFMTLRFTSSRCGTHLPFP